LRNKCAPEGQTVASIPTYSFPVSDLPSVSRLVW
jgi:hypothetical protein